MPEEMLILEELVMRVSTIPVGMGVTVCLGYGLCVGEATIKTVYEKIKGDTEQFKKLYKENLIRLQDFFPETRRNLY